jgi:uncharacterized membrane-anchored protein
MTATRVTRVAGAVVVQLLLVGVAVWAPLAARLTGDEVVLRVEVADDYEPFADAYVPLSYPDLPRDEQAVEGEVSDDELQRLEDEKGTAFVPLTREGEVWVGGAIVREQPQSGLFLRCDDAQWRLRCGIGTAYLATGADNDAVRDALRAGDALATVRVDGSGHAALMGVAASG